MIGVDYDRFWHLTPKRLQPFIEAYKRQREHEADAFRAKANFSAWLQGIYFAKAISVCFSKNDRYYDRPVDLNASSDDTDDENNIDRIKFELWANEFNKNFREKSAVKDGE